MKYVAGGFYIVALENASGAKLLSPDHLNLSLNPRQIIRIRCQNHTPAARMAVRFTTAADGAWDDGKSRAFAVTANDDECREYVVDLAQVPGWAGELRQLRLDLTAGEAATGTVRIDFIRIENPKAEAKSGLP